MRSFQIIAPPVLALLFVYAAVSKVLTFADFQQQLLNQDFPAWFARLLAYTLPVMELLVVLLLILPRTHFAGLLSAFLLLLGFTVYIGLVIFGFYARVPCSCGGILNGMSWKAHFCFNLTFLAIAGIAIAGYRATGEAENLRKE